MALSKKAKEMFDKMDGLGFDTKDMRAKAEANPNLDKKFTDSLTDREEFNTLQAIQKQREEEFLKTARELISAKSASESENANLAAAAVARVAELESALESLGLDEEQIDQITPETISALQQRLSSTSNNNNNNRKEKEGADVGLTKEEAEAIAKAQSGNMAGASILINGRIMQQTLRFERLMGRPMTEQEHDAFVLKSWENLNNNINIDQTMNTLYKLDEKQTEKDKESKDAYEKQIKEQAVADYKREHPETANFDKRNRPDYKGSVLELIDNNSRGGSNRNPASSNNENNLDENGKPKEVKTLEAGVNNNGGYIRTTGFKDGEFPFQIREERGRSGRVKEVMTHVDSENINVYQDF